MIQQYLTAIDQSHIYFLLSGITIGFIIGVYIKQNTKPLTRMRALVCNSYKGAPDSVTMIDDMIAPSICGAEDVLIQVKAASIDPLDIKITFGYGKVIRSQYHQYHKVINFIFINSELIVIQCNMFCIYIGPWQKPALPFCFGKRMLR